MDLGLSDKVAIVTGAGRGIGLEIAKRLAQEGAKVVINDIDEDLANSSAIALQATGLQVTSHGADVTVASDFERVVQRARSSFGGVHILVNNAGFPRDQYLTKMQEEDWDSVISVILKGTFVACRSVMPTFIDQGWGRIVNISSRAHFGNPTQANYSAAKAGLIGMAKALAQEQGRYGVTVNCVAPGFIETEMSQALPTYGAIKEKALRLQPLKRAGLPSDVADAVAFLVSERAGFISGEVLHVSGGRFG